MEQLNWYYPEDLSEAARLISDGNKAPHSGGTALIRRGFLDIKSIVDLSRLPMRDIQVQPESIEIGAMCTYDDIIRAITAADPGHVLVQSLINSASTPLRNRITAGGSVAAFPAWSDFIGPLILLNAEVELMGRESATYSIQDYLTRRELRAGALITRIFTDNYPHIGLHHRETRTQVDYPAFTITVTATPNREVFQDVRIVVVGSKDRFRQLEELENELNGKPVGYLDSIKIETFLQIEFPDRKHGSGKYLHHVAQIALKRILMEIAGGKA
ncbi:MAG: FAD binding domain-containing protein [Holophagae bacterium]|nr:FAD binding domain-containing protein [Holophagae bacterium]